MSQSFKSLIMPLLNFECVTLRPVNRSIAEALRDSKIFVHKVIGLLWYQIEFQY